MSSFLLKLIIGGGLLILIALGVRNYFETMHENEELTSEAEQNDRTNVATTGILDDINTGSGEIQDNEEHVHEVRIIYRDAEKQARREDPSIAELLDTPVPQRLRDLARQRRLDRENGPGRTGPGGGDDGEAPRPGG